MQFIKSSDWHPAIAVLQKRLTDELSAGKKVLWLVSGGSNVKASVTVMQALAEVLTANLTILLADERYGAVSHPNSNAQQLLASGFNPQRARLLSVLQDNTSFSATRDNYDRIARSAFTDNEIVIGQFGIGPDGHIAGILPNSEAVTSPEFVAAYSQQPYQRLTLTPHALKRVSAAYALVFGDDKRPALELLASKLVPYAEQPSQILKELPEAYVFNDQIGETL
ncbi:MAG: 6-phosphogluconolactonase [Patescibacteria group bacterium]|nr:6-phosphogluconolactonase [Patescibacteria group bacterium]